MQRDAALLRAFTSGALEPFWPHFVLLSTSVLASFAVGAGIIFEAPTYSPSTHRIATYLVIWGVVVEAVCTIALFVFDEGISNSQQSKIIELETRIAPRTLSKAQFEMFKQLREKYPAINIASETNLEASGLAGQLSAALLEAGILVHIYFPQPGAQWTGIIIAMENMPKNPSDEPLLKAMLDTQLSDGYGSGSFWNFVPGAPHDVPSILVGEKSPHYMERPYYGEPKIAPEGDRGK